ncbi:hypothetical protein GCM10028805_63590 [Spirosoma harenae]
MKTLLLLIASLFVAIASSAQQTADPNQDPTALGNAFFKAMLDEDATTLGKLLANDFTIIDFKGNAIDGAQLVQGVSGGYVVVETSVVSNASIRQYNTDSAVMTGSWKAKGAVQGNGFDTTVIFTVVCVKQNGAWKIVNVQFTAQRQ